MERSPEVCLTMRTHKGIPILNVYYMLAYAFEFVDDAMLKRAGSEPFENQQELLASLLDAGIGKQLKRGLFREYISKQESIMGVRGRICMTETMRNRFAKKQSIACSFDELSEDNLHNQIIKATARLLIGSPDVAPLTRDALKKKMLFSGGVSAIDAGHIDWGALRFDKNNQAYRFLLSICQLIISGMLMRDDDGNETLAPTIAEKQMHRLYERFILKYFEKHWKELKPAASQIPWAIDDGYTTMLPIMQSDIMLTSEYSIMIIDAKYYGSTLQKREDWDTRSIHSGNLYQIFTYVKNAAIAHPDKNVSGMLLYARTQESIQPDEKYEMAGNSIYVQTLDLAKDFTHISAQLDAIATQLNAKRLHDAHQ